MKYMTDLRAIETKFIQCKDKLKLIDSRRQTEQHTFSGDIQSIKKRVINFERYIKRLKKHVDEEKTTELISEYNSDYEEVMPKLTPTKDELKEIS